MKQAKNLADGDRSTAIAVALAVVASVLAATAGTALAQAPVMCGGEVATIIGTPDDDVLVGTDGDDVIAGLQGNDIVNGGLGDDIICGGQGDDSLYGDLGFDVIFGAQGNDVLVSSTTDLGDDSAGSRMFGGADDDTIRGSTGWDRMQGGPGDDQLFGGASRDWLRGGAGNDLIAGGQWVDDVGAGYGNDTIVVEGPDKVRGGPGKRDSCVLRKNVANATLVSCERESRTPSRGSLGQATMGRANWSSGYVHAAIVHNLLEEVGYEVTDPSDLEFAPDLGYRFIALGEMDLWANSWYPHHLTWWQGSLPDQSLVGDHLARIESPLIPGGGVQGMLVTKTWAEANGVTTLDQINADADLWSQLDSNRNGKGEFYGCPQDWTCDDIMNSQIAFAGWDNLEQVQSSYDQMFSAFVDKAERGEPAIAYTWAPTRYIAEAQLGDLTMWLAVDDTSVLDDSNPLGIPGGEQYCQRCDGRIGYKELNTSTCLRGPDGCQLGWEASDIEITANDMWLARNPVAEELFRQVSLPMRDISELLRTIENDHSTQEVNRAAAGWIAANRGLVDSWLAAALAGR